MVTLRASLGSALSVGMEPSLNKARPVSASSSASLYPSASVLYSIWYLRVIPCGNTFSRPSRRSTPTGSVLWLTRVARRTKPNRSLVSHA